VAQNSGTIVDHIADIYGSVPFWVTVLHGRFAASAETLANSMNEKLIVKKMEILQISPVLGVHTGSGIVGTAVVPMEYAEDLMRNHLPRLINLGFFYAYIVDCANPLFNIKLL
jgi:hypothetical protein